MNRCICENLHRVPRDVDIVLGVPRSGMLPASIIATSLHLPLADLEGFLAGHTYRAGRTRFQEDQRVISASACKRALVVDDSVHTGNSLREARMRIAESGVSTEFRFLTVYTTKWKQRAAEIAFETVPMPRVFQWNLMHHPDLGSFALDIDGVLCRDPSPEENDDGERYLQFICDAPQLYVPTRAVGALVTSRLEKYRDATVSWLSKHGIQYNHLHMLDLPDKATRLELGTHGRFKGEVFRDTPFRLFIESDLSQAVEIARIAGKPALAMDRQRLLRPDPLSLVTAGQNIRKTRRGLAYQIGRLRKIHKLPEKIKNGFVSSSIRSE